jgi:hypothetical protein
MHPTQFEFCFIHTISRSSTMSITQTQTAPAKPVQKPAQPAQQQPAKAVPVTQPTKPAQPQQPAKAK